MSHITENDIELLTIQRLEELGYSYVYGPAIVSHVSHCTYHNACTKPNGDTAAKDSQ